jgi:hypothetical protein
MYLPNSLHCVRPHGMKVVPRLTTPGKYIVGADVLVGTKPPHVVTYLETGLPTDPVDHLAVSFCSGNYYSGWAVCCGSTGCPSDMTLGRTATQHQPTVVSSAKVNTHPKAARMIILALRDISSSHVTRIGIPRVEEIGVVSLELTYRPSGLRMEDDCGLAGWNQADV